MRKKIVWLLTAVMLLSATMLGGCGGKNVTAESLIKEADANMEKVKSYAGDMDMQVSISISQGSESVDMDMAMSGIYETTVEPKIFHMDGTMDMSMLGMSMDTDIYTQVKDGKLLTYTGTAGQWVTAEEDMPETGSGSLEDLYSVADGTEMTLAEKTEKYNDKDVYVLTAVITGDKLAEVMDAMGSMTEGVEVDMSTMEANVKMMIYKDTVLPASVTVDMKDNGDGIEADGVTMKFSLLTVTMTYNEFDSIDSITIPEEALNAEVISAGDILGEESTETETVESKETEAAAETVANAAETETVVETVKETIVETTVETETE